MAKQLMVIAVIKGNRLTHRALKFLTLLWVASGLRASCIWKASAFRNLAVGDDILNLFFWAFKTDKRYSRPECLEPFSTVWLAVMLVKKWVKWIRKTYLFLSLFRRLEGTVVAGSKYLFGQERVAVPAARTLNLVLSIRIKHRDQATTGSYHAHVHSFCLNFSSACFHHYIYSARYFGNFWCSGRRRTVVITGSSRFFLRRSAQNAFKYLSHKEIGKNREQNAKRDKVYAGWLIASAYCGLMSQLLIALRHPQKIAQNHEMGWNHLEIYKRIDDQYKVCTILTMRLEI